VFGSRVNASAAVTGDPNVTCRRTIPAVHPCTKAPARWAVRMWPCGFMCTPGPATSRAPIYDRWPCV